MTHASSHETLTPDDAYSDREETARRPAAVVRRLSFLKRVKLGFSRLTAWIVTLNSIGLLILLSGALWLSQVRDGLIEAKKEALRGQGVLIAEVIAKTAVPRDAVQQEMDHAIARQVLARIIKDVSAHAHLYDADGWPVADSSLLNDEISIQPLPPIVADDEGATAPTDGARTFFYGVAERLRFDALFQYQWLAEARDRTIDAEVEQALGGEAVETVRFSEHGELIVSVSVPIQLVQTVYGVLVLESGEIDDIVYAARAAVLPFFAVALVVSLATSIALTAYIARPIRRLAIAADRVRAEAGSARRKRIPDFTSRKDEIGELSSSLSAMTDALYDRIDAIESFAADVSHELKNPLTSIRSAIETLPLAKDAAARERLVNVIQNDVGRMDRLITDISNASRLDAELSREAREPIEMHGFLREIVSAYQTTKLRPDVSVAIAHAPDFPIFVSGSPVALGQVFRNLIDNAKSFSPENGAVALRLSALGDWVCATIEDHGPGVPPENLETIFKRFYTDRPKGARFGVNSGLGLSITRQIVEAHRGRIRAENIDGGGAQFIVELPLMGFAP